MIANNPVVFCLLTVLVTIVVVFAVYGLSRFVFVRLFPQVTDQRTEDLASSVIFRVASLLSLLLALFLTQEEFAFRKVHASLVAEADSVADLFYDLRRYDEASTAPLQRTIAQYVDVVVNQEWQMLSHGTLSGEAWALWDKVYTGVLDLSPQNARQEALRSSMLSDIDEVSNFRTTRQSVHHNESNGLFWLCVLSGLMAVVVPYLIYPPYGRNLFFLGVFASYVGLVIFAIYALGNPFSAPIVLVPHGLIELLDGDFGEVLRAAQAHSLAAPPDVFAAAR